MDQQLEHLTGIGTIARTDGSNTRQMISEFITYQKTSGRGPVSPDVPAKHGDDYTEACLVLQDSPKASAALSRRTLQNLLRDEGRAKPGNLMNEINQVLPKLPSYSLLI